MKFCKDEMAAQGWSVQELVTSVQFIKRFNKPCRTPQGILWYVRDAKTWHSNSQSMSDSENLHVNVAKAIQTEDDEGWVRRLSLAQGNALQMVYDNWLVHGHQA
jgi:hypothetical protein